MPWRPLPRIAVAVAIHPFAASSASALPELPLEIGDDLYIIEQGGKDGSWYRGYLVAPPSLLAGLTSRKGKTLETRVFSGIFPRCCVEVREHLGDSGTDDQAHEEVDDGTHSLPKRTDSQSPRRQNSTIRKSIAHRKASELSIGKHGTTINGHLDGDGVGSRWPTNSPSQNMSEQTSGPPLSRSLSHRSLQNTQLRSSPDMSSYPLDPPQSSSGKRPQAPAPTLKVGDETPIFASEPLVDEIASCLREWQSKNLHELLLARRYSVLDKLSSLVRRLDLARRQLLYGVLTAHEVQQLREDVVWDLVAGNKMLNDEVIVRDSKKNGRLLTSEDSAFEMSMLQSNMSLLDRPSVVPQETLTLSHLMVELSSFSANGLLSPAISLQLSRRRPGETIQQVTEAFSIDLPSPDILQSPGSVGKMRTVFSDLTSTDIGDPSQSGTELYLVAKLTVSHPVHVRPQTPVKSSRNDDVGRPRPMTSRTEGSISKGGRQSLMWAQKSFGSVRNRSPQKTKPPPSAANGGLTPSLDENKSLETQDCLQPPTQQSSQYVRRNIGVGVINLQHVLFQSSPIDQSIPIWAPGSTYGEAPKQDGAGWNELIRDLVHGKNGSCTKTKGVDHVQLHLQAFHHSDVNELISQTPTLLHDVTVTPKTDFSGVPTKARSDIYVNVDVANLPHQARLSHPERGTVQLPSNFDMDNIQLTLEVRRSNGQRIDSCILPSSESQPVNAWRSPAVTRGEPWKQMIKLSIPAEYVKDAHIIMSLADAPGFPFALCYMPLWAGGAFMKDGIHSPLLYLYDKATSGHEKGRGAYLDFPWSSRGPYGDEKDETLTGPIATMNLETKLCSTHFSQDKTLLGILNWRSQSKAQTLALVKRMSFIPEIEIVKLIDDVLDALFSILVNQSGEEEHGDAVFAAIVTTLGVVSDRRFNLVSHVDSYAETKFDHPYAAPCLIGAYTSLLADHTDLQKARQVRAAFKVGRYILKFILCARQKQEAKEAGIGASTQPSFKLDIKSIFQTLEDLIRDPSPALIGNKTLAVQHMPAWLSELKSAFSEEEILQLASSFIDSCADVQGKLILYKLVLILKLLDTGVLTRHLVRSRIVANAVKWISPYWGSQETPTPQWREQARLCSSIVIRHVGEPGFDGNCYVGKVLQSYRCLTMVRPPISSSFSPLFPTAYPFQSKSTRSRAQIDEALVELAALLPSLAQSFFAYASDMSLTETADVVSHVLDIITSILSGNAFPKTWLSLFVYHHKSMLRLLESVLDLMMSRLLPSPEEADTFNTDLWSKHLRTILLLVRSDTLALETFPEQKRRAVWKIAGDVREQGSLLLKRSWEAIGWDAGPDEQKKYGLQRLGGFQVQYVPGLVSPIVELCLSVHEGLRRVAVKIFQSMIISEWTLNEDLAMVQAEMIDSLDSLYKTKDIANSLVQKMFVNELLDAFEPLARMPLDPLWQAIRDMVSTVDELLELLTAVHGDDTDESTRTTDTLMLMNFYKDMRKEDIFIRYVHQLAEMQSQNQNKTEAGLALQLHADLYTWEATAVRALEVPSYPEQTSFERKEALSFEVIKYFEEGAAWDCALVSYRTLAHLYEELFYDFGKLARTQRAMATIYETIGRGDWHPPRYFRVTYLGLGFQDNLRDRQFVYQGEPFERQSAFTDRLRQLHPSAQILTRGEPEEMEGQYLQVQPVSVYRDLEHPIYQLPKVVHSTREYITTSRPQRFAVTSKRHSPMSGVQDQWIEKTIYTTGEPFPTILRRSEIVAIDTVQLTPLQTALERTTRKTSELAALEKRVEDGEETSFSNLTEAIVSSVDPSSVATVAQYRQLLPIKQEPQDEEDAPEEPISSPMQNALQIALLDHASTLKHCLTLYSTPVLSGTFTSLSDNFNHTFAPELVMLYPPLPARHEPEVQDLFSTPPSTSAGAPSTTNPFPQIKDDAAPPPDTFSAKTQTPVMKSRLNFNVLKSPFQTSTPNTNSSKTNDSFSAPSDGSSPLSHSHSDTASSQALKPISTNRNTQMNGASNHLTTPEQRPPTSHSSRSGSASTKVKKRFSLLGIGRTGSKLERPKVDGMDAVGEE